MPAALRSSDVSRREKFSCAKVSVAAVTISAMGKNIRDMRQTLPVSADRSTPFFPLHRRHRCLRRVGLPSSTTQPPYPAGLSGWPQMRKVTSISEIDGSWTSHASHVLSLGARPSFDDNDGYPEATAQTALRPALPCSADSRNRGLAVRVVMAVRSAPASVGHEPAFRNRSN